MLDKLSGVWAPRPSTGPHKLRECLPLVIILRNRLKFALTAQEAKMILMERNVKVDGKVRCDSRYPVGFMDVIEIPKTGDIYRMLYDVKGRFKLIKEEDPNYKLCKVQDIYTGSRKIPKLTTHDGRTIVYPDPNVNKRDTVKLNLKTGRIEDYISFKLGCLLMVVKGKNTGRVGIFKRKEKIPGSHDQVQIQDADGHEFYTRESNVFAIGEGVGKSWVPLPRGNGVKLTVVEEKKRRDQKKAKQ